AARMRRSLALLALLLFAVTAAAQQPPAATNPTVAATVNGAQITLDEVDALLKNTLPLTPLTAAQRRQMRIEVLSDMVDDLLLRQFLKKNGPKVDPAEIDAQLKAYGEKLKAEGKTLAGFYKETGQTEAQVREAWTAAMQLTGYVKLNTTDEQLKAYFDANKEHFDRVEVKVRHVVLRVGKAAPPTERAAAKEKLEALRGEIAAGKIDFAAAARKHSQCPSAAQGGDLGYILRKGGIIDEAICKAAFGLKVNELSGVIETDFGYHVLQVTDRKPGTPSTYDKSATDVLDTYTDEFRAELIARLRKQGQIQITVP
ncbi:MAG: peptidylprolyl isomerase, partial [Gemmataceae bacterium]|nr:peptidylprolyl isomerase [Gemmataceae bacterium]